MNLALPYSQLSFTCVVYPAIILAYLGQGARLVVDGENVLSNVFYQTIPGPTGGALYWYVRLDVSLWRMSEFRPIQDNLCFCHSRHGVYSDLVHLQQHKVIK